MSPRRGRAIALAGLCACAAAPPSVAEPPDGSATPPSALHRLTDRQLRLAIEDLLGVRYTGLLPADVVVDGYAAVGATTQAPAAADVERLEDAAWTIAAAAVPDDAARDALLGCPADDACLRAWLGPWLARAWRRPVAADEVDALVELSAAATAAADPTLGVQAVVAAALQAPDFLYRVDLADADGRLGDHALAARLVFFLTDAPPDADLRSLADAGALADPAVLRGEVDRLLATDRAASAVAGFFAATLELDRLASAAKDPATLPVFDEALRAAMIEDVRRTATDVLLDGDGTLADLLTTDVAFVDATLAPIYGLPSPGPGTARVTLDPAQDRGGLLGRAGVMAAHAHAATTSPTLRGRLVRARLLCDPVPPPPDAAFAALDPNVDTGSLRERLAAHAADPACAGCHARTDPVGLALEHLDAIGAHRALVNGAPVDATGTLDGDAVDGGRALGAAIAVHPGLHPCLARQLWRHAVGGEPSDDVVDVLTDALDASDGRLRPLVHALVAHAAFARGAP